MPTLCLLLALLLIQPRPTTIRVVDEQGRPAAGVSVTRLLRFEDGKWSAQFIRSTRDVALPLDTFDAAVTDADGVVTLSAADVSTLAWGTRPIVLWAIDREHGRMACATLAVVDSPSSVTLTLRPTGKLKGRIVGEEVERLIGKPSAARFVVRMFDQQAIGYWGDSPEFELDLPAGPTLLMMMPTGSNPIDRTVTIESGKTTELIVPVTPRPIVAMRGKPAPEFDGLVEWRNADERHRTLGAYRGKVVLVEFWGVWCGICVQEMPNLMQFHDHFAGEDFAILAIHDASEPSLESVLRKLEPTLRERCGGRDLPFPVALDSGGEQPIPRAEPGITTKGFTNALYGVTAYPTQVVIGRDGRLLRSIDLRNDADREWLMALIREK